MPANITKIDVNRRVIGDMLKDPSVTGLAERAQNIADAAGPGHEVELAVGKTRARATVRTATDEARLNEATNRTLTRAIDAGRR